ncbi:unnamed protein product [Prorocentrum cordatum]|uniref:Thioredoxin domain-containing protein n=1 Tax=Prorocentrum cordatum TaxID=2364126 RepID=A0ABN9WE91_9DINO|nr:unnamed protein product [Polarella glacialis]
MAAEMAGPPAPPRRRPAAPALRALLRLAPALLGAAALLARPAGPRGLGPLVPSGGPDSRRPRRPRRRRIGRSGAGGFDRGVHRCGNSTAPWSVGGPDRVRAVDGLRSAAVAAAEAPRRRRGPVPPGAPRRGPPAARRRPRPAHARRGPCDRAEDDPEPGPRGRRCRCGRRAAGCGAGRARAVRRAGVCGRRGVCSLQQDPRQPTGAPPAADWTRGLSEAMTGAMRSGREQVVIVFSQQNCRWCEKLRPVLERAIVQRSKVASGADAAGSLLGSPLRVFVLDGEQFGAIGEQFGPSEVVSGHHVLWPS